MRDRSAQRGGSADDGPALASGCIDAFAEQLVAGADQPGDVLVLLGTTLIVWVVARRPRGGAGLVSRSRTPRRATCSSGGPSNAGGLFVRLGDPAARTRRRVTCRRATPGASRSGRRTRVASGSRMQRPDRRAVLAELDLTHDARR